MGDFASQNRADVKGGKLGGGHWVPIPRSFDILPSPTQVGDFALQNRTDVKGGELGGDIGSPSRGGSAFALRPFGASGCREIWIRKRLGDYLIQYTMGCPPPSKSSGLTVKKSWLPGSRRRPRNGCPWKGKMPPPPLFLCWAAPSARAGRAGENTALSRRAGAERRCLHRGRWDGFLLATRRRIWYNYLVMKQGKRALWYADMRVLCRCV